MSPAAWCHETALAGTLKREPSFISCRVGLQVSAAREEAMISLGSRGYFISNRLWPPSFPASHPLPLPAPLASPSAASAAHVLLTLQTS